MRFVGLGFWRFGHLGPQHFQNPDQGLHLRGLGLTHFLPITQDIGFPLSQFPVHVLEEGIGLLQFLFRFGQFDLEFSDILFEVAVLGDEGLVFFRLLLILPTLLLKTWTLM